MAMQVARFIDEIIGIEIPSRPGRLSEARKAFCMQLLKEELTEYEDSITLGDEVDALLDLVYVALGRVVEMGVVPGGAFDEIHRANMTKARGRRSGRAVADPDGHDAVKPKDWKAPDLRPFLELRRDDLLWLHGIRSMVHADFALADVLRVTVSDRLITDSAGPAACRRAADTCAGIFSRPPLPRLLVIGYGRHGKDTAGELLRDMYGFRFTSSSTFCAERIVFPGLWPRYGYRDAAECYDDRHNHRAEWFQLIREFNRPDASALARAILEENDVYCGIRSSAELHACRNAGVFDHVIWIDASERGVPPEDASSCTVAPWMADFVVDNGGDLAQLRFNLRQLMDRLGVEETEPPRECPS
jgi:hypothetical protein